MRYIWYTVHVDITHAYNTFMTGEFWKNILFKGETIWFHRIRATDGQFGKKHSPQKIPDSADFGTTHNLGHNIFKKPTTKSFLKTPPPKNQLFDAFFGCWKEHGGSPLSFYEFLFSLQKKIPHHALGPAPHPGVASWGGPWTRCIIAVIHSIVGMPISISFLCLEGSIFEGGVFIDASQWEWIRCM